MNSHVEIPPIAPHDSHLGCRVAAASDVGTVRKENQDYMGYFRQESAQILVLADGMGGHGGGFEASRIAVDAVHRVFLNSRPDCDPQTMLIDAVLCANASVRQVRASQPDLKEMGTTLVIVLITDGKAWIAHVGDSRAYLVRSGTAVPLTLDHSRVFSMLRDGLITAEAAEHHPMGHIIDRSVGAADDIEPEVSEQPLPLYRNDALILATDGLWGVVGEEKIAHHASAPTPQECVQGLISSALADGSDDNVTVGMVRVVDGPDLPPDAAPVLAVRPAHPGAPQSHTCPASGVPDAPDFTEEIPPPEPEPPPGAAAPRLPSEAEAPGDGPSPLPIPPPEGDSLVEDLQESMDFAPRDLWLIRAALFVFFGFFATLLYLLRP